MDNQPSVEYISRYISGIQQRYTYRGGARPFGVSTLVIGGLGLGGSGGGSGSGLDGVLSSNSNSGVDTPSTEVKQETQKTQERPQQLDPQQQLSSQQQLGALMHTDPSGLHVACKAAAIGRNTKSVEEYLLKHYKESMDLDSTLKLGAMALLEVVDFSVVDVSGGVSGGVSGVVETSYGGL